MISDGDGGKDFLLSAWNSLWKRKASGAKPGPFAFGAFRTMFSQAPEGMALLDGRIILETNPAWDLIFGRDFVAREHAAGAEKPLSDFLPGFSQEHMAFPAEEAGGSRPDGSVLRVEVSGFPIAWGERTLRVVSARNVSNRSEREQAHHADHALAHSDGVLRLVLARSPLVLFVFDKDGMMTAAEGKGLEAMGVKPGELVGQSLFARSSRLKSLQGPVRRALDGQEVDEAIEVSGNVFEVHFRAVSDAGGGMGGVMGLAVDVTERKKAEEDLRKSKEHLRTVISNAPVVLFALDAKGVFTLCEGKGLEAMGLKPGEAVGKSAFELYRQAPQIRMNIRRALSGEEFISTSEMSGLWLETYYSPIFKGYDEVSGVIGVGINVTDRKRAEDALKRSEEQLRHSRKMEAIGRVAGGVAHDFNNLLTAITGYAELLLNGPAVPVASPDAGANGSRAAEQQRKNLEEIRNASERATSLTRQLLAFSRRQVLSPKALNLNQVVGDMDKILRRLMREDIELVTVLDPRLGEIWADPGQLEQVILNLALNARDAMPGGGQLTLETSDVELEANYARSELFLVPGPYVVLSITDTGIGMDAEVKSHLFEPFFTTKEEGKGLGLGLSTVYGIVKQSGGTIVVESEKGRGTTFKLYLPRVGREKEAMTPLRGPLSESLKGVETVLLVEDEEAVRTLVREILRMHGYEVLEARHGGEAILISQRHGGAIHLLLTDMVMANMSGKELADHLRPLRPEMRVLYISGYSEELVLHGPGGLRAGSAREGSGRGAVDRVAFLAKPFTPKTLATKVREVLDEAALGMEARGAGTENREVLGRA